MYVYTIKFTVCVTTSLLAYINCFQRYIEASIRLKELYEDKDGLRKEEISALSGPHEFQEFYSRLKQIKEFHRKHPNEVSYNNYNRKYL